MGKRKKKSSGFDLGFSGFFDSIAFMLEMFMLLILVGGLAYVGYTQYA